MRKTGPTGALGRRSLALFLGLCLFCNVARATWSIVVVDTRTGEVCVASATCLANFDLERYLPVIVTGVGGGAAQSFIDVTGQNRLRIWDGLHTGMPPAEILATLAANDPQHQTRQYGIVDMTFAPVGFTGTGAGLAKTHVAGIVGDLRYAIGGNVLTGSEVVLAAEAALLGSSGDLSQRVLAGMEAARALGGDGRCSCSGGAPTSCGVPPASFTKSAHVGFIVLARIGDVDGVCNPTVGCASGRYFLNLNVIGSNQSPDPVLTLQADYALWRAGLYGRPDQIHSTVALDAPALVADGRSQTSVRVRLFDIDGVPIAHGGATLLPSSLGTPLVQAGLVTDHGDGSYSFPIVAGTLPGSDTWRISVDDGQGQPIVLQPDLSVRVDPLTELHSGRDVVSAVRGAVVPLTLNLGPQKKGRRFLILGSASGTQPGILFRGAALPLNADAFLRLTFDSAGGPLLPNSKGVLDLAGRAVCGFQPPPSFLSPWVGRRLEWSAVILEPQGFTATTGAGFDVVP
jgi:hypothetical protein